MTTERSDNTRVSIRQPILPLKLTWRQKNLLFLKELSKLQLYDADEVDYYRNMLLISNTNAFGKGIQGYLTLYNPATLLELILSDFDYTKGNAIDFLGQVAGVGLTATGRSGVSLYNRLFKGVFPTRGGALGNLPQYSRNAIGQGAEAIVVDNTPTTVGKITSIPTGEMAARNRIPNTIPSNYIGYVRSSEGRMPTYILRKVKVLDEETFPRYVDKLDKSMQKSGFRRVNDPTVLYRAYTNGQVVIDDIAPGNVGLDWLRRPKMIDFNLQTVPEWLEQGLVLKKGGKL